MRAAVIPTIPMRIGSGPKRIENPGLSPGSLDELINAAKRAAVAAGLRCAMDAWQRRGVLHPLLDF
jgi:hypothetical protein